MSKTQLRAIDEALGLWEIEKITRNGWCWRTTLARLDDGTLLVISPIRGLADEIYRQIGELGTPSLVVAPNFFHYMGLADFIERYPEVQILASETATPRLTKKSGLSYHSHQIAAARLPAGWKLLEAKGTKNGELWLLAGQAEQRVWIVSDAFFNVTAPTSGFTGLMLRLTGTTPGLRIGRTWNWLALADKRSYREWLLELLNDDPPTVLVPGHGEIYRSPDLIGRIEKLVANRL